MVFAHMRRHPLIYRKNDSNGKSHGGRGRAREREQESDKDDYVYDGEGDEC